MGALSQKLNASIIFGGGIDASWGRSTSDLGKGLKGIEKQSEKLAKQQKQLAERMKQAKMAGHNIGALRKKYAGVTAEIKKTAHAQEQLTRRQKRAERLQRFGAMGKRAGSRLKSFAGSALGVGAIGGVIGAGVGALLSSVRMNAQTAEAAGKARSYGVGIETYNAWDSLGKQMGLNGENVGDLLEELKNKAGEYKATGKQNSLNDAFQMLGFGAGDFAGLNNEQQFEKIMARALSHKDEQEAASAVDMLMGGESNKILTYMRLTGKSYKELMDQQKRYNLVTKEGADGAVRGNMAFSNLRTVWGSAVEQISGQLGGQLAPWVTQLADQLSDWFKNGGIEVISNTVKTKWIPNLIEFGNGLVTVTRLFLMMARKLAWLLPDEQSDKKAILRAVGKGDIAGAREFAGEHGQGAWLERLLSDPDKTAKLSEIYRDAQYSVSRERIMSPGQYWNKADTRLLDAIGERGSPNDAASGLFGNLSSLFDQGKLDEKPQVTDNSQRTLTQNIYAAPGQDAQTVADSALAQIKRNDIFNGQNALYDKPGGW